MKTNAALTLTVWISLFGNPCFAADAGDLVGDWMLTLQEGRGEQTGLLELAIWGGGLVGHVEGGPTTVSIDGDDIRISFDDRTGGGEPFERQLVGTVDVDLMEGRYGPNEPSQLCREYPTSCPDPSGTWSARRIVTEEMPAQEPRPVDLSGNWAPARGSGGIGRFSMDLTPQAQEWVDDFRPDMDLPAQRCVSGGLVRTFSSGPTGVEILQSDERFAFLYPGGQARRIYMNGRSPPEFIFPTPLGYSVGAWEGSTLVIETIGLQRSVRGYRGEPISANARIVEHYSLSEDGTTLTGLITLYDPENYNKPPIRRREFRLDNDAEFVSVSCDPDSFYRQLYEDGLMQEYIERSNRRF